MISLSALCRVGKFAVVFVAAFDVIEIRFLLSMVGGTEFL